MNQKQKKIEKTLRILSYKDIKKEPVFEAPKKPERWQKTGAKLLLRSNPLRLMIKKAYFKKALALATIVAVIGMAYMQDSQQASRVTCF